MTREEFYAMPRLSDYFPLTFESGRQKWTSMSTKCGRCDLPLVDEDFRGYVVPIMSGVATYRDAPTTSAYRVMATAMCNACQLVTPCEYTLHEDMTYTGRSPTSGLESVWTMRKATRWERLVEWLQRAVGWHDRSDP